MRNSWQRFYRSRHNKKIYYDYQEVALLFDMKFKFDRPVFEWQYKIIIFLTNIYYLNEVKSFFWEDSSVPPKANWFTRF